MYQGTAIITGSSSGIGLATAQKFAQHNYRLILIARREELLVALKEELSSPVHIIKADVSNSKLLKESLLNLPDEFKDIDILVNNAGITLGEGPVENRDIEDIDQMVSININGLLYCTQIILPLMASKNSGHIINVGSTAGTYPRPGNPLYCASKAFSKQFSLALRADLVGKNIRVTSIEPGTVKGTELALGRVGGDHSRLKALYEGYEYLTPNDVAEAIYWAAALPKHININRIDLMATCQSFSHLTNHKS